MTAVVQHHSHFSSPTSFDNRHVLYTFFAPSIHRALIYFHTSRFLIDAYISHSYLWVCLCVRVCRCRIQLLLPEEHHPLLECTHTYSFTFTSLLPVPNDWIKSAAHMNSYIEYNRANFYYMVHTSGVCVCMFELVFIHSFVYIHSWLLFPLFSRFFMFSA